MYPVQILETDGNTQRHMMNVPKGGGSSEQQCAAICSNCQFDLRLIDCIIGSSIKLWR